MKRRASSAPVFALFPTSTAMRLRRTIIPSTSICFWAARSRAKPADLYLIYPQGNPICATEESPYLQIGEVKYGRPILDRGIDARKTTLDAASKYAMLSFDATMRSNATVGPPIELLQYRNDSLSFDQYRRFSAHDSELDLIHTRWEQALRRVVDDLPSIQFAGTVEDSFAGTAEDSNSLQAMTFESGRLPIP